MDHSFLLPLRQGLEVHVPSSPTVRRGGLGLPLIGTRLLARAGVRTDIDFRRRTVSLWLHASLLASVAQWPHRLFGGRQVVIWHR
jgi:hypothetical protein